MKKTLDNHPVWDLPTRLFHWLLVISLIASWVTFKVGNMDAHSYCGYASLTLILFRLCWGFVGSVHSRFRDFVKKPKEIFHSANSAKEPIGHNPLGGLSVLLMLTLIMIQAITGLFNSDDIMFDGPYNGVVDSALAETLGSIHAILFYWLLGFIALHISAIVFYEGIKGQRLVLAMLSGYKRGISGAQAPVSAWKALVYFLICAGLVSSLVYLAPDPVFLY